MTSRLAQMQARFQQKQMQEKEEKLLRLYENQQQRTIERVSRGSAGSDGSVTTISNSPQGGKVRQMFDERRQKAGIDRSYPLEPLKTTTPTRSNGLVKPAANRNVGIAKQPQTVKGKTMIRREDNNANDILYDKREELVGLMNDHNLNESLDDEQLPTLGIDEVDESGFTGKLANVGGKLLGQNGKQNERKVGNSKILTTTFRKDTKPTVVKRTVAKAQSSSKTSSSPSSSQSSTPKASTPSTPSKSTEMSTKKLHPPSTRTQQASTRALKAPHSAVARDDLDECQFCNRRFASDRLQTHQEICARTAKKKRKTYDALKHRVQGTELEPFVKKPKGPAKITANQPEVIIVSKTKQARPASAGKKSNWRQTHEDFISTIRAAKMAQQHIAKGGKLSDLPPPPPSTNPDYVQCPHCGRRFNQGAAERHIPKCATFQFNKPKNGSKTAAAKSRGSSYR